MSFPREHTFRWHVRRIVVFWIGVAVVAGAGLWGVRNGILPSAEASLWVGALIFGLSSWIAALASLIVPGRKARGFWKSTYIIGPLGLVSGFGVLWMAGWRYGPLFNATGSIELAVAALVGATIIRLALLVTE